MLFLAILCAVFISSCSNRVSDITTNVESSITKQEDLSGYTQASEENAGFIFPEDYGEHPTYKTEWWYYTGNLETESGREFGYQFTLFRRAIAPSSESENIEASDWRTNQIYVAHAAIADIENDQFFHADKAARGSIGLAGAEHSPYNIWIENWEVIQTAEGEYEMYAEQSNTGFRFSIIESGPPVLHGINGYVRKSEQDGIGSYYYSQIGLETKGNLWIDGENFAVTGKSWKDHEVGSSFIADDAIGWDWFSAQFDNGEALMYGHMRLKNDDRFVGGSWINRDSSSTRIEKDDVNIIVLDTWTSKVTGATYPSKWAIEIPSQNLKLEARTAVSNAELVTGIGAIYWEGPIYYEGTKNGVSITGSGYVELTGYVNPIDF